MDRQTESNRFFVELGLAFAVLIAAFFCYWGITGFLGGTYENPFAYFDKLAAAFLRGDLHIRSTVRLDLTNYNGRWYVPFPPLPALLLVPYMWITDSSTVDTVLYSIVLSAFNVLMVYGMLTQLAKLGWAKIGRRDIIWLTVLFGLGNRPFIYGDAGDRLVFGTVGHIYICNFGHLARFGR